jgi:hypothetical protein
MFVQNVLFLTMLGIYANVIYNVYHHYTIFDGSISSILKQKECNEYVLPYMTLMGLVTLVYEFIRRDIVSFVSILVLLIGIYGVIVYDNTMFIHYIYGFLAFISILCFMIYHCYRNNKNKIFFFSVFIQLFLFIMLFLQTQILHCEIYLLLNFAFFFIYLHFH